MMKPTEIILIVEDDEAIGQLLTISLVEYGFKARLAQNLKVAKREFETYNPSLIILDLGLPDGDGKDFIKALRATSQTPIIILSARNDEKEIIRALDFGADDYMVKPFSTSELLARVRSTLRRVYSEHATHDILTCKDIKMDLTNREVTLHDTPLKLTPTEYNLLQYFMQNANKVLHHQQILKEVWGVGYQNQMQYLRTYINSLRKKIELNPTRPTYITTESSIGYRFSSHQDKGCHE